VDAIVEVEGLVKKFDGRIRALDSLTLTVARGSVYGLLGPTAPVRPRWSACWRPCCCPMRAARAGIDVLQDPAGVRARIGLAGQATAVDELLTGRENLEMVGRLYGLPTGPVGADPGSGRNRHYRAADHPVPRGGRTARQPDRRHRPRPPGQRRHQRPAQGPPRRRRRRTADTSSGSAADTRSAAERRRRAASR
jgi:hypothetical protein